LFLNDPVRFLGPFQSYLTSKSCLIHFSPQKFEFFSLSHVARDTAHAEFKVRASFAVLLPTLANFKIMIVLHKNIQLYIGYKDQALKSKEKKFAVQFYYLQSPKPTFYVQFLTVSTLVGSHWLIIDLRPGKFRSYLAPSIICSTKEKNRKSDDVDSSYTRLCKHIQNALPRNLKYVWALMS
jgi:hypothetical protein